MNKWRLQETIHFCAFRVCFRWRNLDDDATLDPAMVDPRQVGQLCDASHLNVAVILGRLQPQLRLRFEGI